MERLEKYLDQVCRGIGGPPEMRAHVRQELREHLLDAVAQHKAAGLSEAESFEKALDEFGKPEEVRSELEATHGQRMTWIIDKAMQWKEKTMKAKWLWVTWAYLGLITVVALQVLFIIFNVMMIIPKFQKLLYDGMIDQGVLEDAESRWMVNFLFDLRYVVSNHTFLYALVPAAAWGIFEWRVKSEHKPFMRIAALGTIAVALMVVVMLMAASLVIVFCLGMPALGAMTRPWAVDRVDAAEASVSALEQALAKKDWPDMQKQADKAAGDVQLLLRGPAVTSLAMRNQAVNTQELRGQVGAARNLLLDAQKYIREHDETKLATALQEFRKVFAPVREAAKRPAQ